MERVSFSCTACRHEFAVDAQFAGTIQGCPSCGQRVIIPDTAQAAPPTALASTPDAPAQLEPVVERQDLHIERAQEAQTSRKLKMGSGCFAMLAVMFAIALIAVGVGTLTEIDEEKLFGIAAVIAGLSGLAAFVFFGYIATETASSYSDRGRR